MQALSTTVSDVKMGTTTLMEALYQTAFQIAPMAIYSTTLPTPATTNAYRPAHSHIMQLPWAPTAWPA